jgi:ferric-dicitrate binding protein FerR (iron transport regulator)
MKEYQEELIARYLAGESTDEERLELERWVEASGENRQVYEEVAAIVRDSRRLLQGLKRVEKQRAWRQVWRRTGGGRFAGRVTRLVASICLPFLMVTGYLVLRQETGSVGDEEALVEAIEPGSTRATLFLSDGQRVELRERHEGSVVDASAEREIAMDTMTNTLNYHESTREVAREAAPAVHRIIVPRGGEYPLTLSDGTRVWLNAETELSFPLAFGPGAREVRLSGEAFLEVAREEGRPFVVWTEGGRVEVTGTTFNVSCYPGTPVVTTLESGRVAFIPGSDAGSRVGERRLQPGEQAVFDPDSWQVAVEKVELKYFTSWRDGRFYFYNSPLREITEKLGRWYDVRFEFEDATLERLCFSGVALRTKPIELILELLEHTCPLHFVVLPGRVIRVEQV